MDYKGGAAFADCVKLPHTVGLVTDLSPHLVRRALASLNAELRYREHILNAKKAKDLLDLQRRGDPECPPSLVIVVDEFAALVQEVPEFVDGVVNVAQRGRSLGLHLILATQRPAGVIKDNLRANTNLRIALRMADESDSTDVLGVPLAAGFSPDIPGRGAAKTGPGRIAGFQTGYAGGWSESAAPPAQLDLGELTFGPGRLWEEPQIVGAASDTDLGPSDIERLVQTISVAAGRAEIPLPRKPWLPDLAPTYDLQFLGQRRDRELAIGVVDDPDAQQQRTAYFYPDVDGNMAIYGTGGSGKSTLLRTVALAAGITPRSGPCQVYGMDFGSSGLRMLESLPHVGAVVSGDDDERLTRLIRRLKTELDERANRYAAVRAATITEYRDITGQQSEPRILLLVDGLANFRQQYESHAVASIFTVFNQLAADGRPVGIHIVVTADRTASIPSSLRASIQRTVVLRLSDEADYGYLGVAGDALAWVIVTRPGCARWARSAGGRARWQRQSGHPVEVGRRSGAHAAGQGRGTGSRRRAVAEPRGVGRPARRFERRAIGDRRKHVSAHWIPAGRILGPGRPPRLRHSGCIGGARVEPRTGAAPDSAGAGFRPEISCRVFRSVDADSPAPQKISSAAGVP